MNVFSKIHPRIELARHGNSEKQANVALIRVRGSAKMADMGDGRAFVIAGEKAGNVPAKEPCWEL